MDFLRKMTGVRIYNKREVVMEWKQIIIDELMQEYAVYLSGLTEEQLAKIAEEGNFILRG